MKIAFVHSNKAFLPEVDAYRAFFESYNIQTTVVDPKSVDKVSAEVEWRLMGTHFHKNSSPFILIHEYASISSPPYVKAKDIIKRNFSVKPDFRLFLNKYVEKVFLLNDAIPYGRRDMGINLVLQDFKSTLKEFDFIYVGELSAKRRPETLIDHFTRPAMRERTLLLLGKDYAHLQNKYQAYSNIIFRGPVRQQEVKDYILRSRFGINYIPDIKPFNQLTSTKFLEYAACDIPIISSDYTWIKEFQQQYGGNYYYLTPDLSNFSWDKIISLPYSSPDLSSWTWEQQIRKSGILEFLQSKFPELEF